MLQVFYLNVAYAYNRFSSVFRYFASVSDVCCKCFSYFRRMLQVFHLNVVKVYLGCIYFRCSRQVSKQGSR
jgi:hypothetical protein